MSNVKAMLVSVKLLGLVLSLMYIYITVSIYIPEEPNYIFEYKN